jgi:ESF2/ABP1 family protein
MTRTSRKPARDTASEESLEAGPSQAQGDSESSDHSGSEEDNDEGDGISSSPDDLPEGMDPEGFVRDKFLKPLTPEALAAFQAAQDRAGVIYISRIPPGMRPTKVRHLMSAYGDIGRVYLQQEDAKRAYLRRKYTSTKKPHYTEGWVEFKDKKVARSVAEMLNAQPIGGKKGTRWRDDIWTMKYLPRFKWNMLTEQVAHEAAVHAAKLRVELSQSKTEQQEYLKNVELARVLDKRVAKKREKGEEFELKTRKRPSDGEEDGRTRKKRVNQDVSDILSSIF